MIVIRPSSTQEQVQPIFVEGAAKTLELIQEERLRRPKRLVLLGRCAAPFGTDEGSENVGCGSKLRIFYVFYFPFGKNPGKRQIHQGRRLRLPKMLLLQKDFLDNFLVLRDARAEHAMLVCQQLTGDVMQPCDDLIFLIFTGTCLWS